MVILASIVTLLLWCGQAVHAQESLVLIANPSTPPGNMTRETVRAIFAMRQRTLPSGEAAHVFVLPDKHPLHERFTKEILGVYPHQLRLSWDRLVFSGTGQAPNEVGSVEEMRQRVASTPGGLGYLNKGAVDDSVSVFSVE
ncbi:substrate-binding domain-containing protein [Kushneria marisflavi]|uniref:substrate-binding domain-containing protein n=1 Tax=Kushneria marisflavi TaxID=157779 RepID=UPI001F20E99E|nr:substrate-binding domain-containing protein [Kushneria marisflavi]